MSVAIKIENVGKKYIIRSNQRDSYLTLRDIIANKAKGLLRKSIESFDTKKKIAGNNKEEFWALNGISINIEQGDRLGIVGRNGAGKSTLLKILSRITEPTIGKISIKGRVSSLLEVGTGFHPELTGRENIYLNGAILGMRKAEIKRKFDEIVEFSEIGKFLETPVKRYSSGMYVRLAFAVAAYLESEILIVDEVLAVGDMEFQKKCLGKMNDISKTGERTVLFVSHNMGAINQLCNKAVLLKNGRVIDAGTTSEIVKSYMKSGINNGMIDKNAFTGPLLSSIEFHEVIINDIVDKEACIAPSEEIKINIKYSCKKDLDHFRTGITIHSNGMKLFSIHDAEEPYSIKKGEFISEFVIPKYLLRPGDYSLSIFSHDDGNNRKGTDWIYGLELLSFSVLEEWDLINDSHNEGLINISAKSFSVHNQYPKKS